MLLTTLLCLVLLTIFTYRYLNNIVYVCRDSRLLRHVSSSVSPAEGSSQMHIYLFIFCLHFKVIESQVFKNKKGKASIKIFRQSFKKKYKLKK